MQVGLHEIEDEVDVAVILGLENVAQAHNVGVAGELLEVLDFAVRALGVRGVTKGVKAFLQGEGLSGLFVNTLPNDSVGTLAKFL
jgi:hypothetical protein